jgi:WD40 repeat protein
MVTPENAGSDKRVRRLAFRNDGGQIAVALWNGYIVILDAANGERVGLIQTQRTYIHNLTWSADGKQIMVVSIEGGIEVWDASSSEFVQQLDIDPAGLSRAAWSADGSLFATADRDGIITFWDADRYEPTRTLDIQIPGYVSSMAWSPDKSTLYAGIATDSPCTEDCDPNDPEYKSWVAAWDVMSGRLVLRSSVGDAITSLAVSPNREWVAAGGGIFWAFEVLDASTGNMHAKLLNTHAQDGVAWLDNTRVLYLPNPKHVDAMSISQWDMAWAEHTEILLTGYETISSMAWLPDGERLVTNSGGGTISFWQTRTGQRLEQFQLLVGTLPLSKFGPTWISPVEAWLAAGAEGSLAIVDLEKREVLKWLEHEEIAPKVYVVELIWSKDGQKLAGLVGDASHARRLTVVVWDVRTGERLLTIPEGDLESIHTLSWSPDGKKLVLSLTLQGSENIERLAVWELDSGKEVQSLDVPCTTLEINWFAQDQIAFVCYAKTHIWDLMQGKEWESPGPTGYPEISPGGNLAVTSSAMEGIRLWDFRTGEELALLQAQSDWFRSFAFSPDGKLLASLTEQGSVIVWNTSGFYSP